ncbi:hypothetical protein PoB_002972400 [Plakobranchus ocellatus]|uniref:Uncharacterized protein n=1 Tax=Plakobranchus ocellatus TaxID=259542 RepID=A0AAV4A9T0_9GAST|nr:hypothetical protein PoB_002972400 [Plakobranchus ocellatus]
MLVRGDRTVPIPAIYKSFSDVRWSWCRLDCEVTTPFGQGRELSPDAIREGSKAEIQAPQWCPQRLLSGRMEDSQSDQNTGKKRNKYSYVTQPFVSLAKISIVKTSLALDR